MNSGKIRFGSAGIGGTYQIFGDTFANLISSKSKKYNIEVKTTAGSAANLRLLSKDYIQMAVAQMDLINDAYNRTGIFENDKKYQMASSPENAKAVRDFLQSEVSGELTPASLETLTIIA
jgi:TRAP-type uncharacterized transport system substrate-binding protein